MRRYDLRAEDSLESLRAVFESRLADDAEQVEPIVRAILADVRSRGDAACLDYTRRFDYPEATVLRVPDSVIAAATERVQRTPLWAAMQVAAERIQEFHLRQVRESWMTTHRPGELLGQKLTPLRRVGIYIPGGRAAYPSTVLMVGIPASVAGVRELVLTTPPARETGYPPDATLAAAHLAGIHEVYALGGAQAVGALAYGTESVARVDKVVGPGNVFVNLAKRLVFGTVGIDMLAGPSEVALLLDGSADPENAARELICQTEHDPHNAALIATPSAAALDAVLAATERQLQDLPRGEIVREALEERSFAVVTHTLDEAAAVVNLFAPEHLHILCADPWPLLGRIENAGAILLGPHTTAAHGDYVAGPSHTLPTAGCARFASPVSVDDFVKKSSVLYFDAAAAAALSAAAATFGTFEGLEGHARSARG